MIEQLFNPKSVCIVGVSLTNENGWGRIILKNCIASGFKGNISAVGSKSGNIDDVVVYKSITNANNVTPIEMVVVVVPAKFVANVLKECGKAKIKAVIIISAGFSELGNHELEQEVVNIANKYDISFCGPNTFGVINKGSKLNVSLIDTGKL